MEIGHFPPMPLLLTYLKHYKKYLALALILATINQTFSLLDPIIFRYLIDNFATKASSLTATDFTRGVILFLGASIGVAFISRVAKNFQDYYVNVIVQRLGTKLYSDSIAHSFRLAFAVFEDQRSGEFLQKLQKARTDAQGLIQASINTLFLSLIGITFVLIYAFLINWMIGTAYLLMIPALGFVTFLISRRIKTIQTEIITQTASLAGSTTETIRNVELVKSLGLETQEVKRLNSVNEQILQLELKKIRMVRALHFIQGTTINALRSGLMLLMLWLIFKGDITLGEFFSLLFYSFFIFNPLAELGNVATIYQEAKASLGRLEEILQTPVEKTPERPAKIGELKHIELKNVSFHYGSIPEHQTLKNISVSIKEGQTVAFAGPSGSGKTTIIKLIVGLYKPTSGDITYNNNSINNINLEELRYQIGFVSQDTQLFAGTIKENLLFAAPNATDEDCILALKEASALPIINKGKDGLNTKIGEGGLKLSGGEKQRLAIARALIRNPEVIIFDEATSSLDSLTEEEITKTIKDIKHSRPDLITILIAHRLSTIIHADTIHVLEKGQIAESGTHSELVTKNGLYSALWRQQIASS